MRKEAISKIHHTLVSKDLYVWFWKMFKTGQWTEGVPLPNNLRMSPYTSTANNNDVGRKGTRKEMNRDLKQNFYRKIITVVLYRFLLTAVFNVACVCLCMQINSFSGTIRLYHTVTNVLFYKTKEVSSWKEGLQVKFLWIMFQNTWPTESEQLKPTDWNTRLQCLVSVHLQKCISPLLKNVTYLQPIYYCLNPEYWFLMLLYWNSLLQIIKKYQHSHKY